MADENPYMSLVPGLPTASPDDDPYAAMIPPSRGKFAGVTTAADSTEILGEYTPQEIAALEAQAAGLPAPATPLGEVAPTEVFNSPLVSYDAAGVPDYSAALGQADEGGLGKIGLRALVGRAPSIIANAIEVPATVNEALTRALGMEPSDTGLFGAMRNSLRSGAESVRELGYERDMEAVGYGAPSVSGGELVNALNPRADVTLGERAKAVGTFIPETLLASTPDMAATLNPLTLGGYVASRTNEVAKNRAANDNRQDVTLGDVGIAAPAAAVEALLERFTTMRLLPHGTTLATPGAREAVVRIAKELGLQSTLGGTEELVPYLAENTGTETGATARGALETFVGGAVAEGAMGATAQGVKEVAASRHIPTPHVAPNAAPRRAESTLAPEPVAVPLGEAAPAPISQFAPAPLGASEDTADIDAMLAGVLGDPAVAAALDLPPSTPPADAVLGTPVAAPAPGGVVATPDPDAAFRRPAPVLTDAPSVQTVTPPSEVAPAALQPELGGETTAQSVQALADQSAPVSASADLVGKVKATRVVRTGAPEVTTIADDTPPAPLDIRYGKSRGAVATDSGNTERARARIDRMFGQSSEEEGAPGGTSEIAQVVRAAQAKGNQQAKALIHKPQQWLGDMAREQAGMDIDGFSHVIDSSAVRHTLNNHGDAQKETARGQLPVTAADFDALPDVVEAPQKVVFGTKNRIGRDQVGFLKKMPDGTWLYFEETRTGKRELASVTLRKYPATMNAESIVSTLDPNAQGDGGNGLIVVDGPAQTSDPLESVADAESSRSRGSSEAERLGLRSAVDEALGKAGEKVIFLHGYEGLPEKQRKGIQARAEKRGGKGRTAALYDPATKNVYVFTNVVRTADRAIWNAAHELAGHHGLRTLLGDGLNRALDIALQNPTVTRVAKAIAAERNLDMGTEAGRLLAAEEALAELAAAVRTGDFAQIESRYKVPVPEGIRERLTRAIDNFLKRLKAAMDDVFGRHEFSDEDVRALLENAWQAVSQDGQGTTGEDADQVAFHGTPHAVDRFSLQKIGTGEGAQAYGWGLYFASRKDIAEGYRNKVKDMGRVGEINAELSRLADVMSADSVGYRNFKSQAGRDAATEYDRLISERDGVRAAPGKLYQVEVPEDSDLLDFDKPLTEQPPAVRAKLDAIESVLGDSFAEYLEDQAQLEFYDLTGNELMQALRRYANEGGLPGDESDGSNAHREVAEFMHRNGIPGLRYLDGGSRNKGEGTHNYVIWDEAAISEPSALEAVEDPAASTQRQTVAEANTQKEATRQRLAGELPVSRGTPGWNYDSGAWEGRKGQANRVRTELQDKMLPWRDVQNQIESQLQAALPDAQNVYRIENLMHGRVSEGIDRIERDQIVPLVDAMKAAKVKPETLEEYLYARHAKERNAQIAGINPRMPDGGSGMTNAEADKILAGADKAALEPLAKRVDAITRATRKRLLDSGLITQEQFDGMQAQYSAYVPLRGKATRETDFETGGGTAGRGIDSRAKPVKAALGRGAGNRAVNILGEVIGDAQRSVVVAEKARVGRAVMRIVLANPNPSLWTVEPVQTERKQDANGEVYDAVVNDWSDPSIVAVRHKGKLYKVEIQNQPMAQALNTVGVDQLGAVTRAAGAINRYLSAVLTKYNPAFVPVNATRDALFGLTGLAVEKGETVALEAALSYPKAILAAGRSAANKAGSGEWDAFAKEFAEAGGKTGYVNMPSAEDLARKIGSGKLSSYSPDGLMKAARAIADTVGVLNDAVENALRLSAYGTLRKRGESAEAAAEYAKNLTVNFNRKGLSGSKLNAWFLFYNAALQGAHRTSKLLRKPKTYAYLGALAGAQVIATMAAMGMADDDGEPLWNKVPDHVKRRNLVIVLPSGHLITIPMPYGFNLFTYMSGRVAGALSNNARGDDKPSESAGAITASLMSAASESFLPVPLSDGTAGLLPSVARIGLAVQFNENDFGRPIRDEAAFAKSDVPRASMGKPDTLELFKLASTGLNRMGGGDDLTPPSMSWFDRAPEDLEYLLGEVTGGTGQFIVDVASGVQKATGDEPATWRDAPITKRFATQIDDQAAQAALFYDRRETIDRSLKRVRSSFEQEGEEAAEALLSSYPELKGAKFKRRKGDGTVIVKDGRPQIVVGDDEAVFGRYKAAEKAISERNEAVEAAYANSPAAIFPTEATRARDANIRTSNIIRETAQNRFNTAWVRDVVGAAE